MSHFRRVDVDTIICSMSSLDLLVSLVPLIPKVKRSLNYIKTQKIFLFLIKKVIFQACLPPTVSGGVTCHSLAVFRGVTIHQMSLCLQLGGSDSQLQLLKNPFLGEIWLEIEVCFRSTTDWARKWVLVWMRVITISQIWPLIPNLSLQIQPFPNFVMEVEASLLL